MRSIETFFCPRRDGAVLVKICGVTCPEDAEAVVRSGADAVGINFWPGSKRFLEPDAGRGWLPVLAEKILRVGVFVNPDLDQVVELHAEKLIDVAQLHGDECQEDCDRLTDSGVPVIKALRVREASDLDQISEFTGGFILLDAFRPGEFGGTGEVFDWNLGAEAVVRFPDRRIILAGGLDPENVGRAVAQVQPAAVDVAGGVESAPGKKDADRVAKFVRAARA